MLTTLNTREHLSNLLLELNVTNLEHSDFMFEYLLRCVLQANNENELKQYLPACIANKLYQQILGCLYVPHNEAEIDYLKANKVKFNELVYLYKGLELL